MSGQEATNRFIQIENERRAALGLPARSGSASKPVDRTGADNTNPGGDMDIGMLANLVIECVKYNEHF